MKQLALTELAATMSRASVRQGRRYAAGTRILQLFGLAALLGAMLQGGEWQVGTVPHSVGGKFSSLRMDGLGNAHVAYCDSNQGLLLYSFWDKTIDKWFNTAVDRCGGFSSLALDSKGHPHISYPGGGTGKVMHAYWDGSSWKTQPIETHATVINYYTSIALSAEDYPTISYYEEQGAAVSQIGRLRVVSWNGKYWENRTVDSDTGSGKFNSMVSDSKGNPRIAYGNVEYKNASLRYAWWDGRAWGFEILEGEGAPGTSMWSVALALDGDDAPHIAYTDVRNRILKYGTKRNGKWELEAVDSLGAVAYPDRNGIALDEQGTVYISYYDSGAGLLKVAHQKNRKWVVEVVDQDFAGFTSSLQISHGNIMVTYANDTGDQLKFARRPIQPAEPPSAKLVGAP